MSQKKHETINKHYQPSMARLYKQIIPICEKLLIQDGYKCYFGTHNCKNFSIWKDCFTDMIGFDIDNPTNNKSVIEMDCNELGNIKIPLSLVVCAVGSREVTPKLQHFMHNWVLDNLLPGGLFCINDYNFTLYYNVSSLSIVKTFYDSFRNKPYYLLTKTL